MPTMPDAPEVIEVKNSAVGKMELGGGAMALLFTIPGVRTYSFILDPNGRRIVASMCGLQVIGDINDHNRGES